MRFLALAGTLWFCASAAAQNANPVSDVIRKQLDSRRKNIEAAVEQMPADKYAFKPTPQQMSFAHLAAHIAESNNLLCNRLSNTSAPELDLKDSDPKPKLVDAVKRSFDLCRDALSNADDSKLGESVKLFGGRTGTRAEALIVLSDSWADHYGMAAMYLRAAGLTPPTAKKK